MIAHPVVAYLTAAPVATGKGSEGFRAAFFRQQIGAVEGDLRGLCRVDGVGAPDDHQTAAAGQVRFQRLEGVNAYASLVEASVRGVGFFGVGKKGVPFWASFSAACQA